MAVFRVSKNTNYVVMDRTSLNDPNLSWKAKGLLAYMLSMPDDWAFYDTELEKHAKDGKDALKAAIKELKDNKYMRRERKNGDGGKLIWETTVFEKPYTDLPCMVKPSMDKPLMEKPSMENPQLLSTDELSTELLSTDSTKKEKATPSKMNYLEFVLLTEDEHSKLLEAFGKQNTDKLIENLNDYIGSTGKKYKSHYYTLRQWGRRDKLSNETKSKPRNNAFDELYKFAEQEEASNETH